MEHGRIHFEINTEDKEFAEKVVYRMHAMIQEALDTNNCNKLRILMRFWTVLTCNSVASPASLIELYEVLISSAAIMVNEDGASNLAWQAQAEFYVFCILVSLPWAEIRNKCGAVTRRIDHHEKGRRSSPELEHPYLHNVILRNSTE